MGVGPAARTRRGPAQFHARAEVIQDAGGDARPTWLCTSRSRAVRRWAKVTDGVIKENLAPKSAVQCERLGERPHAHWTVHHKVEIPGLMILNKKSAVNLVYAFSLD